MPFDWRSQPDEVLEQHFNPRVAVPDFQTYIDRYTAQSIAARQRLAGEYDLRYGDRPQQTFDLHRAPPSATRPLPLVLFIHGGYWRALDKRDHSGERTVENFPGVGYDPYSPRDPVCSTCHRCEAPCSACLPDELPGKSDDGLNGYVIGRRA